MNKAAILTFIFGCGAGFAAGYYTCKAKLEKGYSEQVNSAREHYKAKYEADLNTGLKDLMSKNNAVEENDNKKDDENVIRTNAFERVASSSIPNVQPAYSEIVQKTNYSKYSEEVKEGQNVVESSGPSLVSELDYDDYVNYDKLEVTYFKEDDVFMDSKENVWNDGLSRIGDDNLMKLLNDGVDEAFIINDDFGEGYHLTLDEGSFEEYMMGV